MAIIRPFRAWRYNEEAIRDINLKFSPLFDVVSQEQLQELYEIPNNSIHLSVPKSQEEALDKLAEWKSNGIIRQDPLPGIYIYYQKFSLFGEDKVYTRKGFVTMVRIEPDASHPDDKIVLHEDTITHSVMERTSLLEKTQLNVAPTHGLYDDPDKQLEALMDAYMEEPMYAYIDYQGVINELAIVQHKEDIDRFMEVMRDRTIYLADGHHRLASSRQLLRNRIENGEITDRDTMDHYHLMYLTNLRSDDLRILPIHRTLEVPRAPWNEEVMLEPFREAFEITDVTQSRLPLYQELAGTSRTFGLVWGTHHYLLRLRDNIDPVSDNPLSIHPSVKALDYSILHYFVFDKIFGLPYKEQHGRAEISYVKDYPSVVKAARNNPRVMGFVTPSSSMEEMMSVCNAGAIMPQKSTYFYPKVVCGLVFASIKGDENEAEFDLFYDYQPD